jgi:PadR family transcriptional regulator, regulatory protein PadR
MSKARQSMARNSKYRDLFPGALELMILQTLKYRPTHGYDLAQRIKDLSSDLLRVEEGSLYPALQRMLKEGWLESEMGVSARNRPVRVYKVTNAGLKHLDQELFSLKRMLTGLNQVLAFTEV